MEVKALTWLGTRTERAAELRAFYEGVLRLPLTYQDPGMTGYRLADGSVVEVFDADEAEHRHFTTGPVTGFQVDDLDAAAEELAAAGVELLGGIGGEPGGWRWQHFRGPDGNVYELSEHP